MKIRPLRAALAMVMGFTGVALWVGFVVWAQDALCEDNRLEPFTLYQLHVNLLAIGCLIWWRFKAKRNRLWRFGLWGWLYAGCGLVPAALYFLACMVPSIQPWFWEHGWLESTAPVLLFPAAVLFAWAAVQERKRQDFAAALVCCLLSFVSLMLAMEEISWGQMVFRWDTPDTLFSGNVQKETNLHNYLNAWFPYLYDAAGYGMGVLAVMSIRRCSPRRSWWIVIPPAELAGLAFAAFLFRFWQEVFEQQVAWFLFWFAWLQCRTHLQQKKVITVSRMAISL